MSQRRTRRVSCTAAAPLSRLPLQVERLERRSMLAADMGDPQDVADLVEAAPAGASDPPLAFEACVLIDPGFSVDARITTDPPDLWLPLTVDPGMCEAGGELEGVDGQAVDVQASETGGGDSNAGDSAAVDSGIGDSATADLGSENGEGPTDPSTEAEDASAMSSGGPAVGAATDGTETGLPEGFSITICPGVIDPPVLLAVDPALGDSPDATDSSIEANGFVDVPPSDTGTSDTDSSDIDGTAWAVGAPWFGVIERVGIPISCYCSGGLDGSVILAMPDAAPAEEPVVAVTAVDDGGVAESAMTIESTGDEQVTAAAMASSTTAASVTAAPAVAAGPSDAARLFAAYAAGLGQGGADAQAPTGFGGRRAVRRAS